MRQWPGLFLILSMGLFASSLNDAIGKPEVGDEPLLLQADEIDYDRDQDTITARGHVEIQDHSHTLMADEVVYEKSMNLATARGNVRFIDEDGQVIFAKYMEITDDLKTGFVQRVRMRLVDDSRLAAIQGYRRPQGESVRTYLTKGVYSPCNLCKVNPRRAPLWQIKAQEVYHDDEKQKIVYKHAFMEMYGVPVMYTPYFSHSDPKVKKHSGFLMPVYGNVPTLGAILGMPYYWVIRDDIDMTLMPIYTAKQGWIGAAQYRQHFGYGIWELNGSYTQSERVSQKNGVTKKIPKKGRGHVKSVMDLKFRSGLFLTHGEGGFKIFAASDPTYVRRYSPAAKIGFDDQNTLTSRLYYQEYYQRSEFMTEGFYFQGQRITDNQSTIPLVAPNVDLMHQTEPGRYGQYLSTQVNGLVLGRTHGTNVRRFSMENGGYLPYISPLGDEYLLGAALRTDVYNVDSQRFTMAQKKGQAQTVRRIWPRMSLDWKYPFIRMGKRLSVVLEPQVNITATSSGSNKKKIPNEDGDFEFDDSNVMLANRFSGKDRVDSGKRGSAGFNIELHSSTGRKASLFLAQTYSVTKDNAVFLETGTQKHLSDYVGRMTLEPADYFKLGYRFRLKESDLHQARSLATLVMGKPIFTTTFNYLFSAHDQGFNFQKIQQGSAAISSTFHKNWVANVSSTRDLGEKKRSLSHGAGLSYLDECFRVDVNYVRTFYKDRDIKAGSTYLVTLTFKNLGSISTNAMDFLMDNSMDNRNKEYNNTKKTGELF